MRIFLHALTVLFFVLVAAPGPARADWPDLDTVISTLGQVAGLNKNEIEGVKFAVQEPACAATIVSCTVAQDYSLVVFVAGLKTTKLDNIPGMPALSAGSCKSLNPVQRAYAFVMAAGDKILGGAAGPVKEMLKEQIAEGKSAVDGKIAAIPYIGTVLANWDCGCDAAFKTNFPIEAMTNQKVGQIIAIVMDVKSGNLGSALEKMIKTLGPEIACELGAQWTGVGSIPVISDIATEACASVAGKAVEWVVSGGAAVAEALGFIGGDHIPPEQYYQQMFVPQLGAYDYLGWADVLYKKCYSYFEPTNMAADTAKKACGALRARYIEESAGKIQDKAMFYEMQDYAFKVVEPKAKAGMMMADAAFAVEKQSLDISCEAYFSQKYPKAKVYQKAYPPMYTGYDGQYCDYDGKMDSVRAKAQQNRMYEVANKLTPLCKKGNAANSVVCDGQALEQCYGELPGVCLKRDGADGMQMPCCLLGDGKDPSFANNAAYAEKLAKQVGGPYCTTAKNDPLRITCTLKETHKACQQNMGWMGYGDCGKAPTSGAGVVTSLCCEFNPAGLTKVKGVMDSLKAVKDINHAAPENKDGCSIGGYLAGFSYDPRIVNCRSDMVAACENTFGKGCFKGDAGFVTGSCCDLAVFQSGAPKQYDPADRTAEELALAQKAVDESNGHCHFGKTPDGKDDKLKVVCDSLGSGKACVATIGRPAQTPCAAKMTESGYVSSPCCYRSGSALALTAPRTPDKDVKAPATPVKGLGALQGADTTAGKPHKQEPEKDTRKDASAPKGLGNGGGLGTKTTAPRTTAPLRTAPSTPPSTTRGRPERGTGATPAPRRAAPAEEEAPAGNYKP